MGSRVRKLALLACTLTIVAACTSSSSGTTATSGHQLKFLFVRDDAGTALPFTAVIINGMNQAGKDFGVQTIFRGATQKNAYDPVDEKLILQNAIAEKPDGIIVTYTAAQVQGPLVQQAVQQGIPVVFAGAGFGEDLNGALTYIGPDEFLQGQVGGARLRQLGAKHALMVTIPLGVLPKVADTRDAGFKAGFAPGQTSFVYIPLADAGDPIKVKGAIEAEITKDPTIDAVYTVGGSTFAPGELAAYADLGSRAKSIHWATIDVDAVIETAIKAGQMDFGTDQQQYLAGYWPVLVLMQYIRYGLTPPTEIPTGPSIIDKSNVDKVTQLGAQGIR